MDLAKINFEYLEHCKRRIAEIQDADIETLHQIFKSQSSRITDHWIKLYLAIFERKAYLSPQRVRKIFHQLTLSFLSAIQYKTWDQYFQDIKNQALMFAAIGVPFEEVMLSSQLFEEACLICVKQENPPAPVVERIHIILDDLCRLANIIFAMNYYESTKKDWQVLSEAYREEGLKLRKELQTARRDIFKVTQNQLNSMSLAIGSISSKMRRSTYQLGRLQKYSDMIEDVKDTLFILKSSYAFLKKDMPLRSEIVFGLMDESRLKFRTFGASGVDADGKSTIELLDEVSVDNFLITHDQELVTSKTSSYLIKNFYENPILVFSKTAIHDMKDYLFIPLLKHQELLGFIWLASPKPAFFTRENKRYFRHLSRSLSSAIYGIHYYSKYQLHNNLADILRKIDEDQQVKKSLDYFLDFYLSSVIRLLNIERASIMVYDQKTRELQVVAAKGYKVYPIDGLRLSMGEGVAGSSLQDSKIICISKMKQVESRFLDKIKLFNGAQSYEEIKSLACVPLFFEGKPLGVLNMSTLKHHKTFESTEMEIANQLANKLCMVLSQMIQTGALLTADKT